MKLIEAHARLRELKTPVFTTRDAAGALRVEGMHATQVLRRLAETDHVIRLARGRWAIPQVTTAFMLPEALTAPAPAYISLYTALYHRGIIEQIADVTYAITLSKTREVDTPLGAVSLHQVAPSFFFGFEVDPKSGVKIATAEKALLDVLYLRPGRSRRFRALPELELPKTFSPKKARAIADRIASPSRRKHVQNELTKIF